MANPQAENGHIDIANELAEQFARLQLSGNQWRVLWVILRQTYGYHKKLDRISLSLFAKKTDLAEKHISRAVRDLLAMNIITRDTSTYVKTYGLQKDHDLWPKPSPKLGTPELGIPKIGDEPSPKLEGKPSPKLGDTKEKKEILKKRADSPLFKTFYDAYPKHKARRDAEKAWQKLSPDLALFTAIMRALEIQKNSEEWAKENGKYIPYPATWLNGERWKDEASGNQVVW